MSRDYSVTPQPPSTDAAYAAGILDGEGCIYVQDSTRKSPTRRAFYAVVEVGMSVKGMPAMRWMQTRYGGSIYRTRLATEKWEEAHLWHLHGDEAAALLRVAGPYLRLKSEQARMAVLVQDIRASLIPPDGKKARWTEDAALRCSRIRAAIQELNRKGPSVSLTPPMPTAQLIALRVGDEWVLPQRDLLSDTGWARWSGTWPTSGMGSPGAFWTLSTSESPSVAVASSLSDILESPGPQLRRFCLSPKACAGILRRAAHRGKTLPAPLAAALEAVAGHRTPTA
jgi:hypothetical protein